MKESTKKWMEYAGEDLRIAQTLNQAGVFVRGICFHSHQAVEKGLKAILAEKTGPIPRTHNLVTLHERVCGMTDVEADPDQLDFLNSIYIDSRYPFDAGLLPHGEPTRKDCLKALEYAEEILEQVLKILRNLKNR